MRHNQNWDTGQEQGAVRQEKTETDWTQGLNLKSEFCNYTFHPADLMDIWSELTFMVSLHSTVKVVVNITQCSFLRPGFCDMVSLPIC